MPGGSRALQPCAGPFPKPTRLFESHRGAGAGLGGPRLQLLPCLASPAGRTRGGPVLLRSRPGTSHARTRAPALKARAPPAALGNGRWLWGLQQLLFFKDVVVFIILGGCLVWFSFFFLHCKSLVVQLRGTTACI